LSPAIFSSEVNGKRGDRVYHTMHLNWKPSRVFYGWWIVGASFFVSLYTGGVIFYGFTAIFEPIANEFGWSYTQISLAASLRGLEIGLLAPLVGLLVDRWGPRRLIFGGAVVIASGLMLLSYTTSLTMFYGAFALVAIGVSTCSSTVLMTAVANWFRRKVGIATGIMACGYGFGGFLVPVIVRLIDMYEWRMAMAIFAVGALVIDVPLSLLFRHKPEQYGYQPDGEVNGTMMLHKSSAPRQTVEVDIGVKQAVKSGTFWHIALALMCQFMVLNGVVTHVMPYLSSIGIARAKSSLVASAIPVVSISGRLSFGWLADRFDKRRVAAVGFAIMSLGLLFFGYVGTGEIWVLVLFITLFGIGYGSFSTIRSALLREYFGRTKFGTIHGFVIGIMMLGNIIGAPLPGWVFDNWGSYQGIWFVFAGLTVAALVMVATTPPVGTKVQLADKA